MNRKDVTPQYYIVPSNKPTSSTTTCTSSSKVPVTIRQWAQALAQENDSILSRKLRLEFSQLIAVCVVRILWLLCLVLCMRNARKIKIKNNNGLSQWGLVGGSKKRCAESFPFLVENDKK